MTGNNETPARIAVLLLKRLQEGLADAEVSELNAWLDAAARHRHFAEEMEEEQLIAELLDERRSSSADIVLNRVKELIHREGGFVGPVQEPVIRRIDPLRRWWVAASIIVLLGFGGYYWSQQTKKEVPVAEVNAKEIQPGKKGAILKLANGEQVLLDSVKNGIVALQNGVQAKIIDGQLMYEGQAEEVVYNTMSTPKGRQFQLTLPDGSQVWLNSESSIRYPVAFNGAERKVEITGEAYFEVSKSTLPFIVNANDRAAIRVLGTHFNINSYPNENSVRATLLEGSVQVKGNSDSTIIKPGEQAQVSNSIRVVKNIDAEQVMAWKNGVFHFAGLGFDEVMRQLERWYDVDVEYEQGVPDIRLRGEMTMDVTLNGLLTGLEKLGIRYRLENRKLIILR